MLKRFSSSVELLPHDVVELILKRLPVKSLLRFMSVSKTWKLTIETRSFQERQLIHHSQLRGPDILFVSFGDDDDGLNTDPGRHVLDSSIAAYTLWFPTLCMSVCHGSCDGLVCLYTVYNPSVSVVVVNPATRWHHSLPLARIQQLSIEKITSGSFGSACPILGFGKDKLRGTYKPVFLYNSYGLGLDNVTTCCEVFDFSTKLWRYVRTAAPYGINFHHDPVHLDGSLYWFTYCAETKVLSFDLHTETFQVICEAPFSHVHDPHSVSMCVLDNCLCVSTSNWPTQDIWSLDSSGGNMKTWKKMCSIDLTTTLDWSGKHSLLAIAILDKNKLLLRSRGNYQPLVIHDLNTKSYELLFRPDSGVGSVCYFQTLFSPL
ncbi:F-box protein [Raphanus sativus]|uniref:F-box protein At1g11270-like n=1 Tax=Raphanus sativus TaxID=3726 RepID=A0A6J0M6J6_RAPSA|nr:F-box protein At1g11270-like [Raphanus sativus]KAJ4912828.1 F-box protein [Raphanus sativus]